VDECKPRLRVTLSCPKTHDLQSKGVIQDQGVFGVRGPVAERIMVYVCASCGSSHGLALGPAPGLPRRRHLAMDCPLRGKLRTTAWWTSRVSPTPFASSRRLAIRRAGAKAHVREAVEEGTGVDDARPRAEAHPVASGELGDRG
jgi:hypothetical protein